MNTARHAFFATLTGLALGCGSSVTTISYDAGNTPVDAGNTPVDVGAASTDVGFAVDVLPDVGVDSGPGGCRSSADCGGGRQCSVSAAGCGMVGTCGPITDCAAVQAYCGCDGVPFMDCPSAPQRPFASLGACATDAGVSPDAAICAGGSIGPNGSYCAGPADGPLPLDCCTGWDCNGAHALCNLAPPPCEPGYVHLIAGGCYGECVRASHCAAAH